MPPGILLALWCCLDAHPLHPRLTKDRKEDHRRAHIVWGLASPPLVRQGVTLRIDCHDTLLSKLSNRNLFLTVVTINSNREGKNGIDL